MIRRPPRSTLFPTRRSSDLPDPRRLETRSSDLDAADLDSERRTTVLRRLFVPLFVVLRSEEHTSELQSRQYLVCRLLLEKKRLPARPRADRRNHTYPFHRQR